MDSQPNRTTPKAITTLAILVITVAIVFGAKALSSKKSAAAMTPPAASNASQKSETTTQTPATSTATIYKDGTYAATGSYDSPGGTEKITVHLTLANGSVTGTSAESGANDPTAHEFQDEFISGYKALIVGKDISSIHLSHVSGSSLTSQGFNRALDQIKSQAKA